MSSNSPDVATNDRSGYWNDYYASDIAAQRPLPSQFATFVAGELSGPHRVLEFGCGGGRDSLFFSSYGHDVVGVDASQAAVEACEALARALGERSTFMAARIDESDLVERLHVETAAPLIVYARFFVHAITDREELTFLDLAAALTRPGDRLAVEYRTVRDQSGSKVTGAHYRRFVSPAAFQANTLARSFEETYSVEGFGFAKYKQDDAYVARAIYTKR